MLDKNSEPVSSMYGIMVMHTMIDLDSDFSTQVAWGNVLWGEVRKCGNDVQKLSAKLRFVRYFLVR